MIARFFVDLVQTHSLEELFLNFEVIGIALRNVTKEGTSQVMKNRIQHLRQLAVPSGIGPFQSFQPFNRFAPFKTLQIAALQGSTVQLFNGKRKLPLFENSRSVGMNPNGNFVRRSHLGC
jgi:hypothetical protein